MATRTVANGGGNYNAIGTWVEGAVPTSADDVVFTPTSGQLTVNINSAAKSIDFTNYVNTITFTATLVVSGNINLGSGGYTQNGGSGMMVNATSTMTSNGVVWSRQFLFAGTSQIFTLADNWNITGLVTVQVVATGTLNGNTLNLGNGLSVTQTGILVGTTNIIFNGTGTWSHTTTGIIRNNVTINTSGTITFGTNVRFSIGTFTYVAGTVVTTGSTFTTDTNATLDTNGMVFNTFRMNGTSAVLTLTSDLYCNQFSMGVNAKTINGSTIYNGGNLGLPGNNGDVIGTTNIVMNGTGTINMIGTYMSLNITIDTLGTITLDTVRLGDATFRYISGTVISIGTFILARPNATIDAAGISFLNLSSGTSCNVNLASHLTATGTLSIAQGHTLNFINTTNGFTVGGITVNGGTLILAPAPVVYTMTTNMATTNATLAAKGLIRCATVNGTKAILNLSNGATQDNGYLSATDVDSSGGRSIWTYKGILTRTINWNQMSTNPKKHVLNYKNRILK